MKYRNCYCTPHFKEDDQRYHGTITGLKDDKEISAGTIDDFMDLFHQTVDDYHSKQEAARKKRRWIIWAVIIGIVVVAAITCPKKEKHVAVLSDRMNAAFAMQNTSGSDMDNILGGFIFSALATPVLNSMISVDDYFLFSVGHFVFQGEDTIVSIGAFGHVFTLSKDQMIENVKKMK